jgi:hypothetical protein
MLLSQYPRPPADTGWGFHDSAGADSRPGDPAAYARYLRQELGITWFKALVMATNKVDLVRAFVQQGIEVIVRLYTAHPHPHYVVSPVDVQAYVQAGVRYIEWGNEPNLVLEWDRRSWDEGARVDKVCEQFLRNAEVIRRVGGIPLLPALAPGGDYPHRDWYRTTFEWFRANGQLRALEGAALAVHNRPLNRPLAHRDNTGEFYLDYEWLDDLVRAYVGRSLPLLGTEAGYEPGWHQDPTFPPIDPQRHATYNVEILRGFGPHGSRRWRDPLFCQCMWLVEAFGHHDFSEAAWHNNRQFGQGAHLPAVATLRSEWQARPFERKWSWESKRADYPQANWRGSPNASPRPAGVAPALIVLYTTGTGFHESLQRLQDPASRTSYHYLVARTGGITQLVAEADRAWHAGDASWQGRPRVNDYSIAIGLVSSEGGGGGFPAVQLDRAATLVRHLMQKYRIALQDVVTGDMIRGSSGPPGFDLQAFHERLGGAPRIWPPEEVVRAAAWRAMGIPYSAEAALPQVARAHDLGNPETPEFDFEHGGRLLRGQGYSEGIVFAEIGQWDKVQVRPW